MNTFVSEAELLGGAQTFIGVLITLLVLCLFHDKDTNFMLRIVFNMIADFLSSLAHSVERMRADLEEKPKASKSEQLAQADFHWLNQSMKYPEIHAKLLEISEDSENKITNFVNSHKRHLERLRNIQQKVDKKTENELVSHSMLLILMVVMTLDSIGISLQVGSVFLCFLMLLSSVYFTYLWIQYLAFKSHDDKRYKTRRTRTLLLLCGISLICSFIGWAVISALTSFTFWWFLLISGLIFSLPIIIIACCITTNFKQSERYNKKFVTNHTIYILIVSAFVTYCVTCLYNCNLLFGIEQSKALLDNLHRNVGLVTSNVNVLQRIFVIYAVLNAFFIPIFAIYSFYQVNSIYIKLVMSRKKTSVRNELSENREKFVTIVHEMLEKEKKGR